MTQSEAALLVTFCVWFFVAFMVFMDEPGFVASATRPLWFPVTIFRAVIKKWKDQ